MFWTKRKKKQLIELHEEVEELKLRFTNLELELALILKKLKFKYKITKRDLKDKEETEDIKTSVLLPE